MNLLIILLIIVVIYELIIKYLINHKLEYFSNINILDNLNFSNSRGPFYYSINKCNDLKTPYIKADNKYICFDNTVHNVPVYTDFIFFGEDKNCIIEPNGKRITLYESDKRNFTTKIDPDDGIRKPIIFPTIDSYTSRVERLCNPVGVRIDEVKNNDSFIF